jgi:hypothetical protein
VNWVDLPLREGWDFPPPYDHSVPFYVSKCWEEVSDPTAIELLAAKIEGEDSCSKEEALRLIESVENDRDKQIIVAISGHIRETYQARLEENVAAKNLMLETMGICERALELEPELGEDDLTLRDAVAVLRRHGETLGISEEVMDMTVELRPEREKEE